MLVFVKTANGASLAVNVAASATVEELKQQVVASSGMAASGMWLVANNKLLAEGGTLAEYGVSAEATVYTVAEVDGGKKKKKKKKIFKGPKKHAHRHKNVAMRVLKYYKVEGDGNDAEYKVTRLRTECPHPDCGAGVFMAQHKDRQTCGKCSLTYVAQKK